MASFIIGFVFVLDIHFKSGDQVGNLHLVETLVCCSNNDRIRLAIVEMPHNRPLQRSVIKYRVRKSVIGDIKHNTEKIVAFRMDVVEMGMDSIVRLCLPERRALASWPEGFE